MGTIEDQMHAVMKAIREYIEAWKAVRKGPHQDDQLKILEDRQKSGRKICVLRSAPC